MSESAKVFAADHIGFAVSSLSEAIQFWTEALGFTLERHGEMEGEFLREVTGVDDPNVKTATVRAPDGFAIELLQYSQGHANGFAHHSAGAVGAAHLALIVENIAAAITRVEAAGWTAKGSARAIERGPRRGTLVAYVSGPDHITVEFMQTPVS